MTQPTQLGYGFAGTSRYGNYYRHSGQLNVSGVVASLAAGVPVGIAMGVAYAAVVVFVPVIKLIWLACLCFGLALGAAPAGVMRRMKVRNTAVALAVTAVVAAVAYYASWVAWESIRFRHSTRLPSPLTLAVRPDLVYGIAARIYPVGSWSMGSGYSSSDASASHDAVSGPFLGLIWLGEAATILAAALFVTRATMGTKPFCEACDRWCDGPTPVRNTAPADPKALREQLEAGKFDAVVALGPPTPGAFTAFARHTCGKCGRLNTLTATTHTIVRDKKGRVRQNARKVVVNKLLVSPEDLARLTPAPPAKAVANPPSR